MEMGCLSHCCPISKRHLQLQYELVHWSRRRWGKPTCISGVGSNRFIKWATTDSTAPNSYVFPNKTKITRLAIPGFWSNAHAPWKSFPIKWRHERAQNFSTEELHFWVPLWHHLMGKTCFHGVKPVFDAARALDQNPGIANLVGENVRIWSSTISCGSFDRAVASHTRYASFKSQ